MSSSAARIRRYEDRYTQDYGYESWLVQGRQRVTLDLIAESCPRRVVEVGCGRELLAARVLRGGSAVDRWVTVEPSARFAEQARRFARREPRLSVIEGFFESAVERVLEHLDAPADLVIVDGLLHELDDPSQLLQAVHEIAGTETRLHVSVPNARSLHRRVACAMGLVEDLHALSDRNIALEQARVFDRERLRDLLTRVGFSVERWGGHTIKPFTNGQMTRLEHELGGEVYEGLMRLGGDLPDLAAEIWMDARSAR